MHGPPKGNHRLDFTRANYYSNIWLLRPTIAVSSVNGTCNITLHCAVTGGGGGGDVNFTWFRGERAEAVLSSEATLRITQRPPDGSLDYTCAVRTKESQSASTISLADRCHETPGFSAGSYVKYLIPLVVALVILLILFGMYRRKKGQIGRHSGTVSINEPSGFHASPRRDPTNHESLNQLQRHGNPRGAGSTPEPGINLASRIRSSRVSGSRRDLRCRMGASSDPTPPKMWLGGKKCTHILGGKPSCLQSIPSSERCHKNRPFPKPRFLHVVQQNTLKMDLQAKQAIAVAGRANGVNQIKPII
nr:uncharacterized protein LOC110088145 isoform X2 [Pogona vitticeps]